MRYAAICVATLCWAVASPAAQRPFLMGTSTFADYFAFAFENPQDKDFFSIHVDDFLNIPWTAFQNGTALPVSWVATVQGIQTNAVSSGKLIYLALGPLHNRTTLAGNVDASGNVTNNWAPQDSAGCYLFASDPNAGANKQVYINYVKYMVNLFHPTYLSLAIEMNIQFAKCPSQKAAYIQWYSDVHQAIKQAYPSLIVFPTFSADYMYGIADPTTWCGGTKTDASFGACFQQRLTEALTVPADRIAFSTYPLSWKAPPTPPDNYTPDVPLEDMFTRVQQTTTRKIWISETGWQGVQIASSYQHASPPSSCGIFYISTPTFAGDALMADYMGKLLSQAQAKKFEAVVWWENRDYLDGTIASACPCPGSNATCNNLEQVYQSGGTSTEVLYRYFGNMGLRYNDGSPRTPVFNVWTSYLSQPYTTTPDVSGGASSLDEIQIYPNPMRPSLGQTGIVFGQLPPGSRVRIYTLAGEKVQDLTASTVGIATWDGNNGSGQKAASGIYFALIEGAGEKKTVKVAIQR